METPARAELGQYLPHEPQPGSQPDLALKAAQGPLLLR